MGAPRPDASLNGPLRPPLIGYGAPSYGSGGSGTGPSPPARTCPIFQLIADRFLHDDVGNPVDGAGRFFWLAWARKHAGCIRQIGLTVREWGKKDLCVSSYTTLRKSRPV